MIDAGDLDRRLQSIANRSTGTNGKMPSTSDSPYDEATSSNDQEMARPPPAIRSDSSGAEPQASHSNAGRRKSSSAKTRNSIPLNSGAVGALICEDGSLPAERSFPIQIGTETFRLSGASIMSDSPSYFTRFFQEQLQHSRGGETQLKTLYIDRDPATFRDIALHLQGYRLQPRDGNHYVKLFADAQFYNLPKLVQQLFESEIYIRIGEKDFRVSRDIFSGLPGNTPNFFTLGFAIFGPSPGEMFPSINQDSFFRPPSFEAPSLLNRSASSFAEILHLLRGYPLHIRDSEHRAELLRDARYYNFRGLEQTLIPHEISYNAALDKNEICIRIEDVRQSGISYAPTDEERLRAEFRANPQHPEKALAYAQGWILYARPFVDKEPRHLILEINDEKARINIYEQKARFSGQANSRLATLLHGIANKMNLNQTQPQQSEAESCSGPAKTSASPPDSPGKTSLGDGTGVQYVIQSDAYVILDNHELEPIDSPREIDGYAKLWRSEQNKRQDELPNPHKRRKLMSGESEAGKLVDDDDDDSREAEKPFIMECIVKRSQWRVEVRPRRQAAKDAVGNWKRLEVVLHAVKLELSSAQRARNKARGFLDG